MLQMFRLLKPIMLKEGILLQQIAVLLKNFIQERKQTNLTTTNVTLFCGIMNKVFDLFQKLNISSSNDSSLSLDAFSHLTILFC